MLLMYSSVTSARLQYIVNFFSQELFDRPIRITNDRDEYMRCMGPKLNYSSSELVAGEFNIQPVSLLFEQGVSMQEISCFQFNFHKAFFRTQGTVPFDIFAASFYLLSRYEEYLPHSTDEYGRYAHTSSLAFREGFLAQPLVNVWLQDFKEALSQHFPEIVFKREQFSNIVTYDIDIAYSYLGKGWMRNIGGAFRSILKGEWKLLLERCHVLLGRKKDPFDCYEWLDALHLYCRIKPYYFFLVARNPGRYDKNVRTASKRFRELIEYYAMTYNVGIHPSWQSGDDPQLLKEELEWLEVVSEKKVNASRQHYLRFTLPQTFRQLLSNGITRDFSMGYGSVNGFRASVCSSFKWYDLEREQSTSLTLYPFCFMDANSIFEEKQTPQQAYTELMDFYNLVKRVNGMLITIWHNNLLGRDKKFDGWNEMFELFMRDTVYWDAYYDGSKRLEEEVFFSRVFS